MFSFKEGLEKIYKDKPMTKMEKLIKRSREYCRSCKNFQELIKYLNLTDSEIAVIESASSLSKDDVVLIITGYTPDMIDEMVIDSEELKRILNMKPEKIYSGELRQEFYKMRIKYLALALDESIVMARQFGNVNIDRGTCLSDILKSLK